MSQNIFSLEGLISWLETQPPETEFLYCNTSDCLNARYLRARGIELASYNAMGATHFTTADGKDHDLPEELDLVANDCGPQTYGAALRYARELLTEETE